MSCPKDSAVWLGRRGRADLKLQDARVDRLKDEQTRVDHPAAARGWTSGHEGRDLGSQRCHPGRGRCLEYRAVRVVRIRLGLPPVLGATALSEVLIPTSFINGSRSMTMPVRRPRASTPISTGTSGTFFRTGLGYRLE